MAANTNNWYLQSPLPEDAGLGDYGGPGPLQLPPDHKAALEVPKGGSSCANCRYVDVARHTCLSPYYVQWNGGSPKLPPLPLDRICSDWWEGT